VDGSEIKQFKNQNAYDPVIWNDENFKKLDKAAIMRVDN
jgi:hypothetical protein